MVARARKASSTEWLRSRRISLSRRPRLRHCHHATNTTIDQPMPIRRRFDPVMLAKASEQGEASVEPGGRHDAPWAATLVPAFPAKTTSRSEERRVGKGCTYWG